MPDGLDVGGRGGDRQILLANVSIQNKKLQAQWETLRKNPNILSGLCKNAHPHTTMHIYTYTIPTNKTHKTKKKRAHAYTSDIAALRFLHSHSSGIYIYSICMYSGMSQICLFLVVKPAEGNFVNESEE